MEMEVGIEEISFATIVGKRVIKCTFSLIHKGMEMQGDLGNKSHRPGRGHHQFKGKSNLPFFNRRRFRS